GPAAQSAASLLAARVVSVEERWPGLPGEPLVAPPDHHHQDVEQLGALLREDVLEPRPPVVGPAFEHPARHEVVQPLGEDLARDAEIGLELLEPCEPDED